MAQSKKVILLLNKARAAGRGQLFGIAKYSRINGPWRFYMEPPIYIKSHRKKILSVLKNLNADGVMAYHPMENVEVASLGLPTVVLGPPDTKSDNNAVGKMAAEHLLERGFHNFAYCGYEDLYWWSRERADAFDKRIQQAGYETHFFKQPRSNVKRSWENEPKQIAEWLKSLPKPIGLLACNDECAEHVIEACKIVEADVPEQVAVLGVDNDQLSCQLSAIPISSVAINFEYQGYQAAAKLEKLMNGENVSDETIIAPATHIITRQSTDILAIEDTEIAKAVRFIRDNSRRAIQVNDVIETVALSRCELYKRFKKMVGRSLHDEIKRARVEQIATMLIETNMSVTQIAISLDFNSSENISRYFKKVKGMSPLTFRKLYGKQ